MARPALSRLLAASGLRRAGRTAAKASPPRTRHALIAARPQSTAAAPPLLYPESPRSAKHKDLASFRKYAEHTGLDPRSTTYVGTHYEYMVADHLATLGFMLQRVGGASDRGIDLLGTWTIPAPTQSAADAAVPLSGRSPAPVRVLLQCKAGAGQRVGPHLVRELEGAFVGAPVGWRSRAGNVGGGSGSWGSAAVLGILVTEKPATKGIRDALARSHWPMAYVCCSGAGHLQQMLWNQQAERACGLAGFGVALRHAAEAGKDAHAHVVLTWQGKPLPPAAATVQSV